MAISTATTFLKYATTCPKQIETATVVGTISTGGNATVIFTSRDVVGSPITLNVAVALSDTATQVAGKIRTALNANNAIKSVYTIDGTGANIVLTKIVAGENDSTLNLSIANGTCAGLTNALTSVNTLAGGTFTDLCPITSYPDMGATPSKLDTTTLSETDFKTSIFGLQETPDLTFEANYDKTAYETLFGLAGASYYFQLDFANSNGKMDWQGECQVYPNGGGVDEVRKMTIILSASTPIVFSVSN
jgi:hypothetical protein